MEDDYRLVRRDGVTVMLVNKGRVLVIKRRSLPFILNPSVHSLLFGGKEKGEKYMDTAYREVREETGIQKRDLRLILGGKKVFLFDKKKKLKWYNYMFVFCSKTSKVHLDIENSEFRWASLEEIIKKDRYVNIFINEKYIVNTLRRVMNECKS